MTKSSTANEDSLPDDDALDAFSNVLPPPKKRPDRKPDKPAPADPAPPTADSGPEPDEQPVKDAPVAIPTQAEPDPEPEPTPQPEAEAPAPEPAAEVEVRTRPAPTRAVPVPLAELPIRREDVGAQRSTQCTVNVSTDVRVRFSAYQLAKKLSVGAEPTNAVVVRRAVLHARRNDLFARMREAIRHRQTPLDDEDDDPEGLFGDVPGRRAERGRVREVAQLPFRPSYEELQVIDALARAYEFANRSEFLDAALDEFLPPLQDKRRRS